MRTEGAALLLLLPALLEADFDPPRWRFRAPVTAAAAGLVQARVPPAVFRAARPGLGDIRLVRGGAEVPYLVERGPDEETLAGAAPARSEEPGATLLTVDLGAPVPADCVRLETPAAAFWRAVEVESADDGRHWREVARGAVYRREGEEALAVRFGEEHARYLRLRIENGDDRPLPVSRISVDALSARILFGAGSAQQLWLYFGNVSARAPAYDLARVLPPDRAAAAAATIGRTEQNPAYRAPWTERHHEVLYAALLTAIAVLAWTVGRFWMGLRRAA